MRLTENRIRQLDKPGMYAAGEVPTLYLRIAPGGSKSWIQRAVIHGQRRDIGLGGWPVVSLREAREQAFDNRRTIRAGGNPIADRRKALALTFREAAGHTFKTLRPGWRNPKTAAKWERGMEHWAFPRIGSKPINAITQADVLKIVAPVLNETPDAGRKLRQSIQQVFAWAEAHGHIDSNPAQGINAALPRKPKVAKHFKALPYGGVADALRIVEETRALVASKLAFRFLVLTAARSGEVRGATWSEIDLKARTWTIPGERMKQAEAHRVPLSPPALALLEQAKGIKDGSGLIFPNSKGRPLSDNTLSKLLRDNAIEAVPHGFRSSFRDWCAETGKDRELAEAALAHTVGGVEGAYFRSDLFKRRRGLMDAWAQFLTGESAKVVSIHGE